MCGVQNDRPDSTGEADGHVCFYRVCLEDVHEELGAGDKTGHLEGTRWEL